MIVQLILQVRRGLCSIRNVTELSRGKLRDKEFDEFFRRSIGKKIEISDLLLGTFVNYIKTGNPIEKRNTVHTLIEQVATKYRAQLEEKNIRTTKRFEQNLPEAIVPDEQLEYILDCVILYVVTSTAPNGTIEFSTRSFSLNKAPGGAQAFFEKVGRYTEIRVVFSSATKPVGSFGRISEAIPSLQKNEEFGFLLRLAKELVLRNQGMINFERDEEKTKMIIRLGFPVERRKVFFYGPINMDRPATPPFGSVSSIPFP